MIEYLPRCPSPEVDVQIAQMLSVSSHPPIGGRHPRHQRRWFFCILTRRFHPPSKAFGLFLVWWISDDNGNGLVALDLICFLPRLSNRREDARNPLFIVIRI